MINRILKINNYIDLIEIFEHANINTIYILKG